MYRNNMVVDIFKENKGGLYYRFKTRKAENIYKQRNAKVAHNYQYLSSQEEDLDTSDFRKLGWVVPSEDYEIVTRDDSLMENHLDKSGFSK